MRNWQRARVRRVATCNKAASRSFPKEKTARHSASTILILSCQHAMELFSRLESCIISGSKRRGAAFSRRGGGWVLSESRFLEKEPGKGHHRVGVGALVAARGWGERAG